MKQRPVWLYILGITGLWHLGRGALPDAAIFIAATIILELDHRGVHRFRYKRLTITRFTLAFSASVAFVLLTFSQRYGVIDWLVLSAIAVFVYLETWHTDSRRDRPQSQSLKRSIIVWSTLLVILGCIELSAYILARAHGGDDQHFPTITVLIDPSLEQYFGRAVFAALWLFLGLRLLRPRVMRDLT